MASIYSLIRGLHLF